MGQASHQSPEFDELLSHYESHGQGHVFRFWERLDAPARDRLVAQAAAFDLPAMLRAQASARSRLDADGPGADVPEPPRVERLAGHCEPPRVERLAGHCEPPRVERLAGRGGDPRAIDQARECGQELLARGRVAVLVVAGGQATRLGFHAPKGAYPLGPVSGRSLFELLAQKIRGLRRRYGRPLPWYVMTSGATDADTRAFFQERDYFGLPCEDVRFFRQEMVPSFDLEGRLLLEEPGRIFENPSGHGGALTALLASGALDVLDDRGIDTLFYHQVDNPLVRIADPVYLGFHAGAGAEMSCKIVRKVDPAEKVGLVVRMGGRLGVIEYTELDEALREARDVRGDLVYWAGNIAVHVFATAFVRRVAAEAETLLPYHGALKRIPALDAEGRPQAPVEPNGLKLERFVFDALPVAERSCVVEADREVEFSPVKNAHGADSPDTARRALGVQYRAWLEAAGIGGIPVDGDIEVDHTWIDGPEDARALGIREVAEARDAILTPPGESP